MCKWEGYSFSVPKDLYNLNYFFPKFPSSYTNTFSIFTVMGSSSSSSSDTEYVEVDSQDDEGSEYTSDTRVSDDEDMIEVDGFAITDVISSITPKWLDEFLHRHNIDPSIALQAPQLGDDLSILGMGETIILLVWITPFTYSYVLGDSP